MTRDEGRAGYAPGGWKREEAGTWSASGFVGSAADSAPVARLSIRPGSSPGLLGMREILRSNSTISLHREAAKGRIEEPALSLSKERRLFRQRDTTTVPVTADRLSGIRGWLRGAVFPPPATKDEERACALAPSIEQEEKSSTSGG